MSSVDYPLEINVGWYRAVIEHADEVVAGNVEGFTLTHNPSAEFQMTFAELAFVFHNVLPSSPTTVHRLIAPIA